MRSSDICQVFKYKTLGFPWDLCKMSPWTISLEGVVTSLERTPNQPPAVSFSTMLKPVLQLKLETSQKATVGSLSWGPALILVPLLHSMAICGDPTSHQGMRPRPQRNTEYPGGPTYKSGTATGHVDTIYESMRSHHQIWGRGEETTGGTTPLQLSLESAWPV